MRRDNAGVMLEEWDERDKRQPVHRGENRDALSRTEDRKQGRQSEGNLGKHAGSIMVYRPDDVLHGAPISAGILVSFQTRC